MTILTFTGEDSAAAMEKMADQLGENCFIVSTAKRGNQIEISALLWQRHRAQLGGHAQKLPGCVMAATKRQGMNAQRFQSLAHVTAHEHIRINHNSDVVMNKHQSSGHTPRV